MARPQKCRYICSKPKVTRFFPEQKEETESVQIGYDEYEVIRLLDHVRLTQEECAEKMRVSRPTITRMYENARQKITDALINGKQILISGGDVLVCAAPEPECATPFQPVSAGAERKVPKAEITRVKGLGFLQDKRQPGFFNGRVITRNGKITAEESRAIAQAAEKYGSGEITMTSRMTIEIQGVPYENIEPLREKLALVGLETGGTGAKVRPVVSCKGTTCQYGLIDTFELSEEIHKRFYQGYAQVKLPHKFKIAVGGCPNNCVKPDLNDLGIIGQRIPMADLEKCRGCKKCQVENTCPMGAAKIKDGKIVLGKEGCNNCGRCIPACPFGALSPEATGYRIYIGGRWGKKFAQGRPLEKVYTSKQEALDIVEKAILLFREQGQPGERFADTIARLGFENVQKQLNEGALLERKQEKLSAQRGGTTC